MSESLFTVYASYQAAKENAELCEQQLDEAEHQAAERFRAVKQALRDLDMPVTVGNLRAVKRHVPLTKHDDLLLALTGEPGYKIWQHIKLDGPPHCFRCFPAQGFGYYELLLPSVELRLCKECYKKRVPDHTQFDLLGAASELVANEFQPNARADIYCWRTLGPNLPPGWTCSSCPSSRIKWHCRGSFDFLCASCYRKKFFS